MPVDTIQVTWDIELLLNQLREKYRNENIEEFWHPEENALLSALTSLQESLSERFTAKGVLGVGGSGVVLKLQDNHFSNLERALKFPRPVQGKIKLVAELLSKEVKSLATLRHPGIVKIIDHGTITEVKHYSLLPYYIMEFITGTPSAEYINSLRNKATITNDFFEIVRQAVGTISYLHNKTPIRFAHLDLKHENFLINSEGQPILIDLGTCKELSKSTNITVVACTRPNAHPGLLLQLDVDPTDEDRARGEIKRSEIMPSWDLWAFALTLMDWLGVSRVDGSESAGSIICKLEPYHRKFYVLLISRLLVDEQKIWLCKRLGLTSEFISEFPIESSQDLFEIVSRLDLSNGPIARIQELNDNYSGSIQAAPRLHVPCSTRLKTVLAHRLFRRLNAITQLGFVYQVFPSAKHSRREHSLGTYANTCRIVRELYADSYSPLFRQIMSTQDLESILLLALFHDLGQFPLAHELEEIDSHLFDHLDLTKSMLRGMHRKGKKGDKRVRFDSLNQILQEWHTSSERLIEILNANAREQGATNKDKLLKSIVSGPIDADKLDYLLRDARHTDVPYPLGIDLDRLFRCITTVLIDRIEGGLRDVPTLGVHAKGRVAAEFVTFARYAMFSQVYWHHTVRAQKAMLSRAVSSLVTTLTNEKEKRSLKADFIGYVTSLPESLYRGEATNPGGNPELFSRGKPTSPEASSGLDSSSDLAPTDAATISWFEKKLVNSGKSESRLLRAILDRKLYKRLWTLNHEMSSELWGIIVKLWDEVSTSERCNAASSFEKRIFEEFSASNLRSITQFSAEDALGKLENFVDSKIPWLLIDIPSERSSTEVPLTIVQETQRRLLREDWRVIADTNPSPVWKTYGKELRVQAGNIHVFCDPFFVDIVDSNVQWQSGMELLRSTLEQTVHS